MYKCEYVCVKVEFKTYSALVAVSKGVKPCVVGYKQRSDVVFCVWRALLDGSRARHDLVALIAGFSYLITGFESPLYVLAVPLFSLLRQRTETGDQVLQGPETFYRLCCTYFLHTCILIYSHPYIYKQKSNAST